MGTRPTHCIRGHEFTPDNTRWIQNHTKRNCKQCIREWRMAKYDRAHPNVRARTLAGRIDQACIPEPNSGCWLWLGRTNTYGYGRIRIDNRGYFAHRISYELVKGPIPEGLTIDHLCRVRCCVNPDHLEAVTQSENTRRAAAFVTHCIRGHEFDEKNTRFSARLNRRECRKCHVIWQAARRLAARGGRPADRKRSHCSRGHELIPENLYVYPYGRTCRLCVRARSEEKRLQLRSA